jgi:hypothetical protein
MSCGGGHLGFPIGIKNKKKMFQNASSLKPLEQLTPNCSGMIIGRSSITFWFCMTIRNPRWPPPLASIVQVVSEKKRFETFFP